MRFQFWHQKRKKTTNWAPATRKLCEADGDNNAKVTFKILSGETKGSVRDAYSTYLELRLEGICLISDGIVFCSDGIMRIVIS